MTASRSRITLGFAVLLCAVCARAEGTKESAPGPGTPAPQEAPREYMMGPSIFQEGVSPAGLPLNKKGAPRPMLQRKKAQEQARQAQPPAPASQPQPAPAPQSGK